MKCLVTCFSATGITAKVANRLADAVDAHVFGIRPVEVYTKDDLNWWEKNSRSTVEMTDPTARPEIAKRRDNMADYERIYIGFPVQWNVAPRIINTFLESYDLTGKTIIPFATSGGSGVNKVKASIEGSYTGANLQEASLLSVEASFQELAQWAGK